MKRAGNHIKGSLDGRGLKIGIVVADFNEYFTARLLEGAVDTLERLGVAGSAIDVYHVPGSFEIPLAVKRILRKRRHSAIIALGVVIKGETRHFTHVVDAAASGTLKAALAQDIPVIHGVVAAESVRQAIDRTGGKMGNKGRDAARAAVEMARLVKEIDKR